MTDLNQIYFHGVIDAQGLKITLKYLKCMCSFLAQAVIEYMQRLLCLQECTIELCMDTQV